MNWKAANEQQDEALWRVFMMFVAMALLVIRSGLVSRGVLAVISPSSALQDAEARVNHGPPSTSAADLTQATLVLLCMAEAAGRLVVTMTRAVWELMNSPLSRPAPELSPNTGSLCEHPLHRLDSS